MEIEVRLKIVVRGKYFYTVGREVFTVDSYTELKRQCSLMMMNFIYFMRDEKFVSIDEDYKIQSINVNMIDEIHVELYDGDKILPYKKAEEMLSDVRKELIDIREKLRDVRK